MNRECRHYSVTEEKTFYKEGINLYSKSHLLNPLAKLSHKTIPKCKGSGDRPYILLGVTTKKCGSSFGTQNM